MVLAPGKWEGAGGVEGERLTLSPGRRHLKLFMPPLHHHHQRYLPSRQTSPGPVCTSVLAPITPPTTSARGSADLPGGKIAAGRFFAALFYLFFLTFLLWLTDRFRSDSNFKIPTGVAVKRRWRRLLKRGELHYPSESLMSSRRYC